MKFHYLSSYYNYTVSTLLSEKFVPLYYYRKLFLTSVLFFKHFSSRFIHAIVNCSRLFKLYSSPFKFNLSNVIFLYLMEQNFGLKFVNTFSKNSVASFNIKLRQKIGFKLHLRHNFLFNFLSIFSLFTFPILFNSMFESAAQASSNYHSYIASLHFSGLDSYNFGFSEISKLFNSNYYINCFSYYYVFDVNGFNFSLFLPFCSPYYSRFFFSCFEINCI